MGISIEFRATYRHTDCPFTPFFGVHLREIVLLSGRLPHHLSGLVRNDREFAKFQFVVPQNDTERVTLGAITDHARHDLAARPAGKFQFVALLRKAISK